MHCLSTFDVKGAFWERGKVGDVRGKIKQRSLRCSVLTWVIPGLIDCINSIRSYADASSWHLLLQRYNVAEYNVPRSMILLHKIKEAGQRSVSGAMVYISD